ncbi:MAG TPA: SDR family oxidoreductase [Acidimicrobiia bacterium]|nr:SDR family oxidoreductase [Acidimicrobiia bacterium]
MTGVGISLHGRAALVTGAGAGIGRATAHVLARAGASVAVNDVVAERASSTVAEIVDAGGAAVALPADVTQPDQVDALVDGCVERLGSLDVAVNNVGMLRGLPARAVVDLDPGYVRTVVDQNLTATLLCAAAEARAMVEGGRGGVIVHVSSGETQRSAPMLSVYAAAKAAVNHLTRSMAVELGPAGIRVLAVAPGTTPTEHVRAVLSDEYLDAIAASTPLQRACTPDDLANLILLLVSDYASAVTGQLVLADMGAHLALQRPNSVPPPPKLRQQPTYGVGE